MLLTNLSILIRGYHFQKHHHSFGKKGGLRGRRCVLGVGDGEAGPRHCWKDQEGLTDVWRGTDHPNYNGMILITERVERTSFLVKNTVPCASLMGKGGELEANSAL